MAVDVLGIGCCAVDEILHVGQYPEPDGKVQVLRRERRCGGLTTVALIAAARLGAKCAYAGALGDGELSQFVIDSLAEQGVDTSTMVRREGAAPVHSVIVVDDRSGSRTILYDPSHAIGADPTEPPPDTVTAAGVLFVDHYGIDGQPDGRPTNYPGFKVTVRDTTGCGDVFHGAYAAALAQGLPLAERIRTASAAAALKASQTGVGLGIPDTDAVAALLGTPMSLGLTKN